MVSYKGNENVWTIAYHGIGKGDNNDTVESATLNIIKEGIKKEDGEVHRYKKNIN